jgi:hypothetical protein
MTQIAIGTTDWARTVAKEAQIPLVNRYFESDPLSSSGVDTALLARPAVRKWKTAGAGPIRGIASQLGMFGNSLFVVSESTLWKITPGEVITSIGSGIAGALTSYVPMCFTDNYLFLADGTNLWVYTDNGFAVQILTATANAANNETVTIGSIVYKFTNASVDAGTPAGTVGNPWLVTLGADTTTSMANLAKAIEATGTAGVTYSSALTEHTQVTVDLVTATTIKIRAKTAGAAGNAIATTETMANASFGAATLAGGGGSTFTTVAMPDSVGAVWVDTIASFVIVVVAQGFGMNGRFYWVQPGATTIDPLDFATAERAPDPIYSVMTLGDQFWLFGSSTTEVWYPTGDGDAPFQRIQGRLFDRGIWGGTAVKIGDEMIVTDRDGVVWKIGQGIERVSNNSIEQRIREAMALELRS